MQVFKTLLAGAAMFSLAVAQAAGTLAITTYPFPSTVSVGMPVIITYSGGGGNPVTITLLMQVKGPPSYFQSAAVLTSTATTGSYTWTPDSSLMTGSVYAFEISQGDAINYSLQFTLVGASTSVSPTVTPSVTPSIVPSIVPSVTSSVTPSVSASLSSVLSLASSIASVASSMSASANASITGTSGNTSNATTSASATGGTGTPARNTTMSMATLTPTSSAGAGSATGDPRGGDASTSGSSVSNDPGVTMSTGGASGLATSLALMLGVFGAIMYLT